MKPPRKKTSPEDGGKEKEATGEKTSPEDGGKEKEATGEKTGPEDGGKEREAAGEKTGPEDGGKEREAAAFRIEEMTLEEVRELAGDPDRAAQALLGVRGEPIDCPKCGSRSRTRKDDSAAGRPDAFRCSTCNTTFQPKNGTVMHGSRPTMDRWLLAAAIVLKEGEKAGVPEISEQTGISQKAAKAMLEAMPLALGDKDGAAAGLIRVRWSNPEGPPEHPGEDMREDLAQEEGTTLTGSLATVAPEDIKTLAGDPERAAAMFVESRGPGSVECPGCGTRETSKLKNKTTGFRCKPCGKNFSIRTGTVMEDHSMPIGKWALAGYIAAARPGDMNQEGIARLLRLQSNSAREVLKILQQTAAGKTDPIRALAQLRAREPETQPGNGPAHAPDEDHHPGRGEDEDHHPGRGEDEDHRPGGVRTKTATRAGWNGKRHGKRHGNHRTSWDRPGWSPA